MRSLTGAVALSLLTIPSPALAGWGDDAWGTMVWGESVAVPGLPGIGLIELALALLAPAAWQLRKRRPSLGLPLLFVLLTIPLVVAAGTRV